MKLVTTLLVALLVSGCAEDGGLGQTGSPAWKMRNTQAEQNAYWKGVCEGYGFNPGTTAMAECIQRES